MQEQRMKEDRCFCKMHVLLGKYNNEFYEVRYRSQIHIRMVAPSDFLIKCGVCGRTHRRRVKRYEGLDFLTSNNMEL